MKSSENRKFEEAWKEAFADTEGNVSDSVWNNIDSQLARAESGEMKKRVVFYKWLAAASVVFALMVGGVFVYRNSFEDKVGSRQYAVGKGEVDNGQSSIAEAKEDKLAVGKSGEVDKKQSSFAKATQDKLTVGKEQEKVGSPEALGQDVDINRQRKQSSLVTTSVETTVVKEVTEDKLAVGSNGEVDSRGITVDNELGKVGGGRKVAGKNGEVDKVQLISKNDVRKQLGDEKILTEQPVEVLIAKTEEPLKEETKLPTESSTSAVALNEKALTETPTETILKETDTVALIESPIKIAKVEETKTDEENKIVKKEAEENWWAAVSGSAGSYNPNGATSGGSFTSPSFQNNSAGSSQAVGTAYSYGVNIGKRIAPRWVLISGVGFLSQSINYPSNQAVFNVSQAQAFSADASKLSTSNRTTAAPINSYELNSINEFVTVPLQAGYLIVNKKVGVQLNAGVASDIFVRNSLVDPTSRLSTNTQSAGENSTYRTFNWTGLVGTELSYKISNHYRISVIPGMRYSFNSILKPTVGSTITPLIWDVGFRFKYIF